MSDDVLRQILHHLNTEDRLSFASIDSSCYEIGTSWDDVSSIAIVDRKLIFSSKTFRHVVPIVMTATQASNSFHEVLQDSLKLCKSARTLWIQRKLNDQEVTCLVAKNSSLRRLFISSENFETKSSCKWENIKFKKLQHLNILQRVDQPFTLTQQLSQDLIQKLMPSTLKSITLAGLVLTQEVIDHLETLTSLNKLNLMGCLVDASIQETTLKRLCSMEHLNELRLPPSVFSFSVKELSKGPIFNFKDTKPKNVHVYMERFHDRTFTSQYEELALSNVKQLHLYGNYIKLRHAPVKLAKKCDIKMIFEDSMATIEEPSWSDGAIKMCTNIVRKWPYLSSSQPASAESWKANVAELTEEVNSQRRVIPTGRPNPIRREGRVNNNNNVPHAPPLHPDLDIHEAPRLAREQRRAQPLYPMLNNTTAHPTTSAPAVLVDAPRARRSSRNRNVGPRARARRTSTPHVDVNDNNNNNNNNNAEDNNNNLVDNNNTVNSNSVVNNNTETPVTNTASVVTAPSTVTAESSTSASTSNIQMSSNVLNSVFGFAPVPNSPRPTVAPAVPPPPSLITDVTSTQSASAEVTIGYSPSVQSIPTVASVATVSSFHTPATSNDHPPIVIINAESIPTRERMDQPTEDVTTAVEIGTEPPEAELATAVEEPEQLTEEELQHMTEELMHIVINGIIAEVENIVTDMDQEAENPPAAGQQPRRNQGDQTRRPN